MPLDLAQADAVLLQQILAESTIACAPAHLGNVFARAQSWRGIAMAVEAEVHGERHGLDHQRHAIDAAVAGFATDAFGDVNVVAEVDVLRQPRDPMPAQGGVLGQAATDRREHRCVGPDLRVTGHAGMRRRQTGARPLGDARMAVAAVDAQCADMVFMTERDRLRRRMNARAGVIVRARECDDGGGPAADDRHRGDDKQPEPSIGGR